MVTGATSGGAGGGGTSSPRAAGSVSAQGEKVHHARSSLVWENVRMALGSMLSTKLRSALTLLGLMIGVGTVIGMTAVISGIDASMRKQIASLGTGVLYVSKYEAGIQVGDGHRKPRKDLVAADARAIAAQCPSVAAVSPEIGDAGYLSAGGVKTSFLNIGGVTESYVTVNDWAPEEGRFFIADDLNHKNRVCVLGKGPAEVLFPHGSAVGQWVDLEGTRYQVIGVLSGRGKFLGQNQDDIVLLPLPILARLRNYGQSIDYMTVRPRSPQLVPEARDEITELLRRRRGVPANAPDDFGITSQEQLLELYHKITGAFYLVTILLSSIGLMVGGIGVMNMMLVSVRERTREIGVRSALGARRRDIMGQFLTEAVTLTLAGGLCGIALGYGLAGIISLVLHVPLAVTFSGIAVAIGISAAVGIFFGWYPAFRASRLDPVEALRFE